MSKKHTVLIIVALVCVTVLGTVSVARVDDIDERYEVTITNLTRGQQFTPILVASHKEGVSLFTLGQPASSQLATLAEEGDTKPLTALLKARPDVHQVIDSGALLNPGASVTLIVDTNGAFDHVSVAAMLIPTNDAFFAINGVKGPEGNNAPLTLFSSVYDAGSERNDELCASIPGPFFAECGGPGGGAKVGGGEGFVHIHAGIHGIGNLDPAQRDWRNPAAKVTIRRIH